MTSRLSRLDRVALTLLPFTCMATISHDETAYRLNRLNTLRRSAPWRDHRPGIIGQADL